MESKIRLMKLKGRVPAGEVGTIPEGHRLYLEVWHEAQAATLCMHAREHTLAHVLDRACKALRLQNPNSSSSDPSLRLSLWRVHEPPHPAGKGAAGPMPDPVNDVGPLPLDTPLAQLLAGPADSSSSSSSGEAAAVLSDGACLRLQKGQGNTITA